MEKSSYYFIILFIIVLVTTSLYSQQNEVEVVETEYFQSLAWWYDYGNAIKLDELDDHPTFYKVGYDADEQVVSMEHYHNNQLTTQVLYGHSRTPKVFRMFKDGEPHGHWIYYQEYYREIDDSFYEINVYENPSYDEINHWIDPLPPVFSNNIARIELYRNGNLIETTYYFYDEQGHKIREENYKPDKENGVKWGYFRQYDTRGYLIEEEYYINGQEELVFSQGDFFPQLNRVIWEEIREYRDGQLHGSFITYNEIGQKVKIEYYNEGDRIRTTLFTYYQNNQMNAVPPIESIKRFTDGRPDSLWEFFNQEGKLIETRNYLSGDPTGYWYEYEYYQGIRRPVIIKFFDEGQIHSLARKYYYPNGNLMLEENYKQGKPDGFFRHYDEEGNILIIQEFKEGEPSGTWYYFDYLNGDCEILQTYEF